MFCIHCGKELPDQADFCSFCGTKIQQGQNTTFVASPIKNNKLCLVSCIILLCATIFGSLVFSILQLTVSRSLGAEAFAYTTHILNIIQCAYSLIIECTCLILSLIGTVSAIRKKEKLLSLGITVTVYCFIFIIFNVFSIVNNLNTLLILNA